MLLGIRQRKEAEPVFTQNHEGLNVWHEEDWQMADGRHTAMSVLHVVRSRIYFTLHSLFVNSDLYRLYDIASTTM